MRFGLTWFLLFNVLSVGATIWGGYFQGTWSLNQFVFNPRTIAGKVAVKAPFVIERRSGTTSEVAIKVTLESYQKSKFKTQTLYEKKLAIDSRSNRASDSPTLSIILQQDILAYKLRISPQPLRFGIDDVVILYVDKAANLIRFMTPEAFALQENRKRALIQSPTSLGQSPLQKIIEVEAQTSWKFWVKVQPYDDYDTPTVKLPIREADIVAVINGQQVQGRTDSNGYVELTGNAVSGTIQVSVKANTPDIRVGVYGVQDVYMWKTELSGSGVAGYEWIIDDSAAKDVAHILYHVQTTRKWTSDNIVTKGATNFNWGGQVKCVYPYQRANHGQYNSGTESLEFALDARFKSSRDVIAHEFAHFIMHRRFKLNDLAFSGGGFHDLCADTPQDPWITYSEGFANAYSLAVYSEQGGTTYGAPRELQDNYTPEDWKYWTKDFEKYVCGRHEQRTEEGWFTASLYDLYDYNNDDNSGNEDMGRSGSRDQNQNNQLSTVVLFWHALAPTTNETPRSTRPYYVALSRYLSAQQVNDNIIKYNNEVQTYNYGVDGDIKRINNGLDSKPI